MEQRYEKIGGKRGDGLYITSFCMKYITIYPGQTPDLSLSLIHISEPTSLLRINFEFNRDKQRVPTGKTISMY